MIDSDSIRILPDLQFSILCDDVRREYNGKHIFVGIFETVATHQFPVIHPSLYIVNRWCNGVGQFEQKTIIRYPDDSILAEDRATKVILQDLKSKHTIIARFNGLQFPYPGEYSIDIRIENETKIRYPLVLIQKKEKK